MPLVCFGGGLGLRGRPSHVGNVDIVKHHILNGNTGGVAHAGITKNGAGIGIAAINGISGCHIADAYIQNTSNRRSSRSPALVGQLDKNGRRTMIHGDIVASHPINGGAIVGGNANARLPGAGKRQMRKSRDYALDAIVFLLM